MIPQIREINFPEYATLHEATVTLSDMGERTITTQIRIDGDVPPVEMGVNEGGVFYPMEVEFKGERFVLPTREPQAAKDNTTRNALVDVTFRSWAIEELKRYFFFTIDPPYTGTAVPDKYEASVRMSLVNFVKNFRRVIQYYWPNGEIQIDLFNENVTPSPYGNEEYLVEISYAKIWDVLTRFYEIFGKRWAIETVSSQGTTHYVIKVNYPTIDDDITDHTFQYGYDGGLLRFERQVQEDDITNILLGRGGEKNLPYRYFKLVDQQNPSFRADPDAIPELANIYFDRLHDATFRWYIRGWMQNLHRDTSWDSSHTFPQYEESDIPHSEPLYDNCLFAFRKGRSDTHFEPIEYVTDKWEYISPNVVASGSIAKYGEHWGAMDAIDDIYPTIQGRSVSPYGRIDQVVSVSPITTDDREAAAEEAAVETSIKDMHRTFYGNWQREFIIESENFTIPTGRVGSITYVPFGTDTLYPQFVHYDTDSSTVVAVNVSTGVEYQIGNIPAGTYRLKLTMVIDVVSPAQLISGTFGIQNIVLYTTLANTSAWGPTFDIWVKNIWDTTKGESENALAYAERVWLPILGDHLGNEAAIVFSTGAMSGADYEFIIASMPVFDQSKTITTTEGGQTVTYQSEWRITVYKSSAELDATGLFIPNAQVKPIAGDYFFFIGIDMPQYYVELAEQELDVTKTAELSAMKDIAPTWVVSLDKVRVHTPSDAEEVVLLADRFKTGIKVRVSDPRFLPTPLELYVQNITFRWQEPSEQSPYIVPDIEVVLSDQVVSQQSPISKIEGQLTSIHSEYVRADMVEEIVRRVASSLYLKKTGESDVSQSPTQFASKVTSRGFAQGGVGGSGWGIYRNNVEAYAEGEESEGETVFEADRIIARKAIEVNTLVVNQVTAQGGKEILSAAKMQVSKVLYDSTNLLYRCYFDQKQGSVTNLFVEGDIVMAQRYNADWSTSLDGGYRAIVAFVGIDYIALGAASFSSPATPKAGDIIVQYGHISDTDRQSVIIRDVVGGGYEQMLYGLTATTRSGRWTYTNGTEYYFAGRKDDLGGLGNPRFFIGSKASAINQYVEYADGRLTIMGKMSVSNMSGSTNISGNFIQTGEIALGQVTGENLSIYAGISGNYNGGIAAWYGGPKVDHEASPSVTPYAKTIFRFDGSGYLASGNIYWDQNGYGGIPGITWGVEQGQNVVTIDSNVRLASVDGDTVTDLLNAVNSIKDWFEEDENGDLHIKNKVVSDTPMARGLWGDSFITAGGRNSGGGGGAATLGQLQDVTIDDSTLTDGQVLKYDSVSHLWVNADETGGGGGGSTVSWNARTAQDLPESGEYIGLTVDNGTAVKHFLSLYGHTHLVTEIFPGLSGLPGQNQDGKTIVWQWNSAQSSGQWVYGEAGGGATYTAGTGLSLTGTEFSVNPTYDAAISHGSAAYDYFSSGVLPVSHGGTGLDTLTSGQALVGNGTDNVSLRPILNNTSATAATSGVGKTSLVTENTLYYALPTINDGHAYKSTTKYYAPTGKGSEGQYLRSDGTGTPKWVSAGSVAHGDEYLPLSAGPYKPLTGSLYAQHIVPNSTEGVYELGSTGRCWGNIFVHYASGKGLYTYTGGTSREMLTLQDVTVDSTTNYYLDVGGYNMANAGRTARVYGKAVHLVVRDGNPAATATVLTATNSNISVSVDLLPSTNGPISLGNSGLGWGSVYTRAVQSSQNYLNFYVKNSDKLSFANC